MAPSQTGLARARSAALNLTEVFKAAVPSGTEGTRPELLARLDAEYQGHFWLLQPSLRPGFPTPDEIIPSRPKTRGWDTLPIDCVS